VGWIRALFLGDIGNRLDIADVETEVLRIRRDLQTSGKTDAVHGKLIEVLLRENAELKIYLSAIVRLLVTKQVVSKEELESIINGLDAADGNTDGKYTGPIT
jgi:hypothetical protein